MADWALVNEGSIRLGAFLAIFGAMALWEIAAARRELSDSKSRRWFANLGLVVIDSVVVRMLFPAAAVGFAIFAVERNLGLFNQVSLPAAAEAAASFVLLDLAIWTQHLIFHKVPWLWRMHQVHHADLDVDVTTGLRFHPFEIVASMLIKLAVIVVLGPPVVAVLVFEVVLNGLAMFSHANVTIPNRAERALRWIVVTPEMHHIHHSTERREHDSNYGFNLSIWDRIFGTYTRDPEGGQLGMTLGLPYFRGTRWRSLIRILSMPLVKPEMPADKSDIEITERMDS